MAKYRALVKSFIDGHLREEGEEFDFAGTPGSSLEPLDEEAKAAKAKRHKAKGGKLVEDVKPEVLPTKTDAEPLPQKTDAVDEDIQTLRDQYKDLFGEDPHSNTKSTTLRQKIADKRKELGV